MSEVRATVHTVARAVGVSAQTVSRVLNGTGQVSAKTRAAVLAEVAAQDYRPNAVGRSLRASTTPMIGVLVADIGNPFYARLHRAIERSLDGSGYMPTLINCDDDAQVERRQLELLRSYRPTGLVIVPSIGSSLCDDDLQAFGHVICVSRVLDNLHVPSVVTNEREAVGLATTELLEHGHTEIAIILGPKDASTTRAREMGFHEALRPGCHGLVRYTDGTRQDAEAVASDLLRTHPGVTGVVGFNPLVTEGIVSALLHAGRRCPDDISVIGFTDVGWLTLHRPAISVIDQPVEEMGALAGRLLLDMASGKAVSPGPRVVASELVRRESVAPPAKERLA